MAFETLKTYRSELKNCFQENLAREESPLLRRFGIIAVAILSLGMGISYLCLSQPVTQNLFLKLFPSLQP